MIEKPTADEFKETIEREAANIRELLNSPLGQHFIAWLRRRQSLDRMWHQDPYVMAYRCAVHDVIGQILAIGDPHASRSSS